MKSGALRNLPKSRMPRQTTSSKGARYKSRNSVNTVDAPDSSVHQTSVSFSDSDDDEFVFTVEGTTTTSPKQQPIAKIAIAAVPVRILVDSGASVNMLDPSAYEAILQRKQIPLAPTKTRIHAFGAPKPLRLRGKFQAALESANKVTLATFYVTDQPTGSLLSYETSIELGILQLQLNSISDMANNPPPQAAMTATGYHFDQSPQPDRDLDTQR